MKMARDNAMKRLFRQPKIEDLSQDLVALSSFLPVCFHIVLNLLCGVSDGEKNN